jgi:hypothetical protein
MYQNLLAIYKWAENFQEYEDKLSKYNSKSCDFDGFSEYIKKKNEVNRVLLDKYETYI